MKHLLFLLIFTASLPFGLMGQQSRQNHSERGAACLAASDFPCAIEAFGKAIANDPNNALLYLQRGTALIGNQSYDLARSDFQRSIILDPTLVESYENLGFMEMALGRYAEAIEPITNGLRYKPTDPFLLGRRCECFIKTGQFQDGLRDCNAAIQYGPELFIGYLNRSIIYFNSGLDSAAVQDIQTAYRLAPDDPQVLYNYALNTFMRRDIVLAEKLFTRHLEFSPNNPHGHYFRGHAYMNLGRFSEALADYQFYARARPHESRAYHSLYDAYCGLSQREIAITYMDTAIQLEPNNATFWNNRGYSKLELGRYAEAITDLTESIRLDDNQPFAYNNRGLARLETGDLPGALSDLNRCLELKPDHAIAILNRGRVYLKMGRTAEACADFRQANAMGEQGASEALQQSCP